MKRTIYFMLALAIILAIALTACGNQQASTVVLAPTPLPAGAVVSEGRIKPVQASNLSFQAQGVVSEVKVKIGDTVKQGDELARLSNAGQAEQQLVSAQQALDTLTRTADQGRAQAWQTYMDAQKKLATAQQKWDNLNINDILNRIDDANATIATRLKDLQDAQDDFNKYQDLPRDNSSRKDYQNKLDNAQLNYDEAVANLESIQRERDEVRAALDDALAAEAEAKHQYDLTANGPNADQLALVQAQVEAAQSNLANYIITAPFNGTVADVGVNVGDQVGPGTMAVSVADFSQWIIETTDLTELEVVKVAVGQKATIKADALPDVIMHGVVTEIGQSFQKSGGDILYTVRLNVKDLDPRAKWGMTVEVTFEPQ